MNVCAVLHINIYNSITYISCKFIFIIAFDEYVNGNNIRITPINAQYHALNNPRATQTRDSTVQLLLNVTPHNTLVQSVNE